MDEQERQRKIEAGRDKFAAFLKKKKGSPTGDEKSKRGGTRPSPPTSVTILSPAPTDGSIGLGLSTGLGVAIQDEGTTSNSLVGPFGQNAVGTSGTTVQNASLYSSICNREGCYKLSTRVKELEETLAVKETALNALQEELATCKDFSVDASTGMLSFGMEADYVTHIERFQKRLEEFAEAVNDRDGLIVQLSEKLKSSNEARAALQTKEEQMAQDVALLQQQLHHTKEIVDGHVWDTGIKPQDFLALQSQLLVLEDTVTKNKSVINGLNAALQQRDMALQAQYEELERKSQELGQHKTKSAKEIQELMREVEELNQRSVLSTSADSQNLTDLRAQLEEEFGLQLVQIKDEFKNQLSEKDKALLEAENTISAQEHQLADTVTVFKSEILSYKQQVEALNVEHREALSMVDRLTSELGSYNVDLALQKEQNQDFNERVKEITERNETLSNELLASRNVHQDEVSNYKKQIETLTLHLEQTKEGLQQGGDALDSGDNPSEVQSLKRELADMQVKYLNEINQLNHSYSKELESFRQRNEALEWEMDNISRNKEKCTAELNACKEAYIAQWGSSKHAQDMEIVSLKEQIKALTVQIQEVSSIQEISENSVSNLETLKLPRNIENNIETVSLKQQVNDALVGQDNLSREISGHKLELALHKQEKEALQQSLLEKSVLAEGQREELQRELDGCRQQVETLSREYQASQLEIEKLHQDLRESKTASTLLQDELSRVSELLKVAVQEREDLSSRLAESANKYTEEMVSYEQKLKSINLDVDNLTKGHLETLSSYHEAQSLNSSLTDQIKILNDEILSYKQQLEIVKQKSVEGLNAANIKYENQLKECKGSIETLRGQYNESAIVVNTYTKELQFWDQQIRELNSQLVKELNLEVPNIEGNLNTELTVHDQLVINFKNNFMTLQNLIKTREESFHSATSQLEDSTLKLVSVHSTLAYKDCLKETENDECNDGNGKLASAMEEELAVIKQQLIESERLVDTKANSELNLKKRIETLEAELLQLSTNSALIKDSLHETTVKLIAAEALSAAKDELEVGLKNRISELEDALHVVNEDSLSIRQESDQVTEKVAKAKDLLERMREENNELSALCKLYEDDASQLREQLMLSEQKVKDLLSHKKSWEEKMVEHVGLPIEKLCTEQNAAQLSAQTQHSMSSSQTGIETSQQQADLVNLAFQIQQFEKYQDELVMRCNRYEEEVACLREKLATSENSLESLRQEVSNNRSSQSLDHNSLSPQNRDEVLQTEPLSAFNKRDLILSGGDSAALNHQSCILGRGFDFGFNESGQALNSTEYMGMDELQTSNALKLIENCSFLENVRNELVLNVQDLQAKLQEMELQVNFTKEELKLSDQRCKVLEAKVDDLTKSLKTTEFKVVSQSVLESKILQLESEYTILEEMQVKLREELVNKQVVYEDKLSKMLHEQLSVNPDHPKGTTLEEVILELGSKAKEVVVLSEKLRSMEEAEISLKAQLQLLEDSHHSCVTQLLSCKEELFNSQKELEESWQKQHQTENELARVGRELAIARLTKDQLEKSQSRLKDVASADNLESSKVSVLKQALLQQTSHNRSLMEQSARSPFPAAGDFSSIYDLFDGHITSVREKLLAIVQKNEEVIAQSIDGAKEGNGTGDNQQRSLSAQLSAYREQHSMLAEMLGSTGVLQEALLRQKQQLLQKTHEKAAIDELIKGERAKLDDAKLKIKMLTTDLKQNDERQAALNRQNCLLAEELQEIEKKLSEREDTLLDQRLKLEEEMRQKDLAIRHWQLQCRACQVEHGTEQALSRLTASPIPAPRQQGQEQLDKVKLQLNAAHAQMLQRMKNHLVDQFSSSEESLQTKHRAELLAIQEEHEKKLASIQLQLEAKIKELEALKQLENKQEKHVVDLDELKNKLDERQKEIYTELRQQFETYAHQKIEAAMKRLQDKHEFVLSSQRAVHEQELQELRTKLDNQIQVELLSITQTLTKQHSQELAEVQERLKAEIAHHKEITNPYPTDPKGAMVLLKQLVCCEFTTSFKALIDSRNETYRKEMSELISQFEEAMKKEDPNNEAEIPRLLDSQEKLLTQTEELLARVVTEHQCMLEGLEAALDVSHEKLQAHVQRVLQESETAATMVSLHDQVARLQEEKLTLLEEHRTSVEQLTTKHDAEVARLQELVSVSGIECGPCALLRQEQEAKHTSEMEELRQYFEKKCTELEKHYSEEVFSQHSRKLSSSSSCESELASDIYYSGGDQAHRINTLTHMCDSYTVEPSYKELEEHYQRDYEKRIAEYREQLDIAKHNIEEKYCTEMETLKDGYDMKVEELVRELAANHSVEIQELQSKHSKDMENLRAQLGVEAKKNEDNIRNEVERTRHDLQVLHLQDLEQLKKTFEERLSIDIERLTDRMLHDEADHIRIVREEMQEKHDIEVNRLKVTLEERTVEHNRQLRELQEKHEADVERERAAINEQVEQLTAMMKQGAEQEQESFLQAQKEMMQGFVLKHQEDLKTLKEQHDSQLRAAQEEVVKLQQEQTEYAEEITQSKRRLHDEIQHDVLKALEDQLQVLLSGEVDEKSWPAELLQLQDKMTARYKRELASLQKDVERLTDELERVRSMKEPTGDLQIPRPEAVDESVGVKQMAATLKCVISEIVEYMSVCEEELNNTLVNQILKYDWENTSPNESTDDNARSDPSLFRDAPNDSSLNISLIGNLNLSSDKDIIVHENNSSTPHNTTSERKAPRRVHFAPDMSTIFNMDEVSLVEYMENKHDVSTEFRTELDTCLERLKAEAAALMGLSAAVPKQTAAMEKRLATLSHQLASEVKAKEDLVAQLGELEVLKEESVRMQERLERLSAELRAARDRVTELESREDVTEGYGEQVSHISLREGLAQLQDQAQTSASEGGVKSPHLHLIEELIQEGDRLMEESKHEKDDLKLQIAAADKQLRSTRQFLEQQALEREQERDEYLHEIENLREQLKATDKDRSSNYHRAKEDAPPAPLPPDNLAIADSLEAQMKDVASNLQEAEARKDELETELKAAIEKVWVLRDIITELESQVEVKSRHETALRKQVEELEAVLEQQNQTNQELMRQLDTGNGELTQHVAYLEEQLHIHRQQMEHFQPGSDQVKQMKTQLREFETTIDKKTKDLESLYTTTLSNTSCSSPSEDVSFRDHLDVMRCATPDDTPVSLPLDQLVRVQEKLNTHSRAEQAALKKIRDLEMQVKKMRRDEDEVTAERDVLQNQVEQQLLKISSIKAHLDEQRTKADEMVQHASVDLEARLHQRELEIRDLKEAVENKEKQLAVAQALLEDTRQAVATQEAERSSQANKDHVTVEMLKRDYKQLREKSAKILQDKKQKGEESVTNQDQHTGTMGKYIPISVLIDTMLATKNAELEELAKRVDELERRLRAYESLELTDEQRAQLNNMLKDVKSTKKELKGDADKPRKKSKTSDTQVLYRRMGREDEYLSSGAESDVDDCNELKQQLLRKESLILSLKNQLAAKELENAEKDELLNKALEKVESASDNVSENTDLRNQLKAAEADKGELERLRAENAKLQTQISELQKEVQQAKAEASARSAVATSSAAASSEASSKAEKDALNRKLEEMRKERDALQSKLNELSGIEAAYNELQRKDKNMDNIIKERDMLRIRLDDYANMEEEMERLKFKAKEAEVMRMDRDRIKAKLDELTMIEAAYLDLLDRSKNMEVIAAERELYKAKYEELAAQGDKIAELEKELAKLREVEKERDFLIRQIMDMQCEIADQEDEIRRLVISVDHLARHSQKHEGEMSQSLTDLRKELDTKDNRVAELEARIAELEAKITECSALEDEIQSLRDQLKEAIEEVARESVQQERLIQSSSVQDIDKLVLELEDERRASKGLKDQLNQLQAENDRLQSELDVLQLRSGNKSRTTSFEDTQKQLESCTLELKDYMEKIQTLQVENDALRAEVDSLRAASGGDSQLEEELVREKQARMYAERELRAAHDKIEELLADHDKQIEGPMGRTKSCEEMIEHYKQKYEDEKKAKEMIQGVLDSSQDELEKEKENKKILNEKLKELEHFREELQSEQRKSIVQNQDEIEKLRGEIARLTADVARANDALERAMENINTFTANEIERLKAELAQVTAERDNLKSQLGSASKDTVPSNLLTDAQQEIKQLNDKINQLTKDLDKAKAEAAKTVSADLVNEAQNEVGKLKAEISRLNQELANAASRGSAEVDNLKAENARLTKDLDSTCNEQERCMKEIVKLKADNDRLTKDLEDALNNAGASAKNEIDRLKEQLASASKDKDSGMKEVDNLKAENARLAKELENAKSNANAADSAQKDVDNLKAENARLAKELENAKSNANAADSAKKEVDNLKAENARLAKDLENARSDANAADSAKKEVDNLKAENARLTKELENAKSNANAADAGKKEVDNLKAENDRLNDQLKKASIDKAECEKLKNEYENLKAQLASVKQVKSELDNLKAERDKSKASQDLLKEAEEEVRKLNAEISRLNAQLKAASADASNSAKAQIDDLKDQLSKATKDQLNNSQLTDEINNLKSELDKMTAERDKLSAQYKSEKDAHEKLKKSSDGSIDDVVKECKDQVNALENKIKNLEKENATLKKELAIKEESSVDDAAEKAEREKLEKIIKNLEGNINDLNSKMAAKEEELKSAKGAEPDVVKNLKSSLEAELKRNQDLQDELKKVRGSGAADEAELDKLRKMCANLEAQCAKLERENQGLMEDYEKKILKLSASFEEKMRQLNSESMDKLQKSYNQFKGSLSPEDHAANIKATEDKYEQKLKDMAAEYEKRIKDMVAAHAGEMEKMQRTYNKNLDDLRNTYDRDMKQMNDRHNNSVLALQKMHETEVTEMNVEYEQEMKTMKIASTDTIKTIEKQHNAELEKLRRAHENTLDEMNKRYQDEKDALRRKLDSNLNEVKDAHKKEMDDWNNRFKQEKLENEAELQRLRDNNKNKIEMLMKQYETLMEEEKRKHLEQLNKLKGQKSQLMQSKTETYVLGEEQVDDLAGKVKKELDISENLDERMMDHLDDMAGGLATSPSLTRILNKVLKHGIEALTFDELSKLHQRTCAATTSMIMQNAGGRLPLEMVPTSLSPDHQGADKGMLCRRIMALEGEIKQRQEEAKQNMCLLENKIRNEEKRLYEMRQVLLEEQRRNVDLNSKLGHQNRRESELESEREVLRRQSNYQEERLQQFIMNLEREKNKCRCLEENLQKERNNTRHLQSLLEADRFRGRNSNIKDSDIIETMRTKLENALDNERKTRLEKQKLESQLQRLMQQPPCPAPCNSAGRPTYGNDMQDNHDRKKETFIHQCSMRVTKTKKHAPD